MKLFYPLLKCFGWVKQPIGMVKWTVISMAVVLKLRERFALSLCLCGGGAVAVTWSYLCRGIWGDFLPPQGSCGSCQVLGSFGELCWSLVDHANLEKRENFLISSGTADWGDTTWKWLAGAAFGEIGTEDSWFPHWMVSLSQGKLWYPKAPNKIELLISEAWLQCWTEPF